MLINYDYAMEHVTTFKVMTWGANDIGPRHLVMCLSYYSERRT